MLCRLAWGDVLLPKLRKLDRHILQRTHKGTKSGVVSTENHEKQWDVVRQREESVVEGQA